MSHSAPRKPTNQPVFPDLNIRVNGQPVNTKRLAPTHVTIPTKAILAFLTLAALVGLVLGYFALKDAYDTVGGRGTEAGGILTIAISVAAVTVIAVFTYTVSVTHSIRRARKTDLS